MKWEKTYDDNKLSNASKKRFVAAKNLCRSGGQLRLVVSKIRKRRMDKNNFVGVSVENQALLKSHDAILVRRFSGGRIVFLWSFQRRMPCLRS
jgi:hypothetical protein